MYIHLAINLISYTKVHTGLLYWGGEGEIFCRDDVTCYACHLSRGSWGIPPPPRKFLENYLLHCWYILGGISLPLVIVYMLYALTVMHLDRPIHVNVCLLICYKKTVCVCEREKGKEISLDLSVLLKTTFCMIVHIASHNADLIWNCCMVDHWSIDHPQLVSRWPLTDKWWGNSVNSMQGKNLLCGHHNESHRPAP